MDVDLRLVRYFVAVADTLHFGRAAEQLFISQPALSQQIRRFEDALGFDLFVRDRRSVALTAGGRALLDDARAALAAGDRFGQAARRQRRTRHGELVVGFHVRWPYNFLPRVLRRYREALPGIAVQLVQHEFHDSSAGLRTSDSDVALLSLPMDQSGLALMEVAREERVVIVAADHPAAAGGTVALAELVHSGLPWAVPANDDAVWRDFWGLTDARAAVDGGRTSTVQLATVDALFDVIASAQAVAVTFRALVEVYRPSGVVAVEVDDLPPAILAVAWRDGDERPQVAGFIEAARGALRDGGHP